MLFQKFNINECNFMYINKTLLLKFASKNSQKQYFNKLF